MTSTAWPITGKRIVSSSLIETKDVMNASCPGRGRDRKAVGLVPGIRRLREAPRMPTLGARELWGQHLPGHRSHPGGWTGQRQLMPPVGAFLELCSLGAEHFTGCG